jgi:uncharacterized protein with PIN domain
MYYLDASAILKLIVEQMYTPKLKRFLSRNNCTSKISRIEVMRVINRAVPEAAESAQRTLSKFDYINVSESVISYDKKMISNASSLGLKVHTPV